MVTPKRKAQMKAWRSTNAEKIREWQRGYYLTHKDLYAPGGRYGRYQRNLRLVRLCGITLEEFEAVVKKQNGCCAICGEKKKLVADHDHDTGRFRGALCRFCNGLLERFGMAWVQRAKTYLELQRKDVG